VQGARDPCARVSGDDYDRREMRVSPHGFFELCMHRGMLSSEEAPRVAHTQGHQLYVCVYVCWRAHVADSAGECAGQSRLMFFVLSL